MSTKPYTAEQRSALKAWLEQECPESKVKEVLEAGPMYGDYDAEIASLGHKARDLFPDIEGDTIDMEVYHHVKPKN